MIPVTKAYLPSREKYKKYVDEIFDSGWLTNNSPLVKRLEERLCEYLKVDNVILVSNGTLALQVAFKALELKGDVVTTPFSFVATTSALVWEGLNPVFADIEEDTFNISPCAIKDKITDNTSAILGVHVFGNPCDVSGIDKIAKENNVSVIYDSAHAFGVEIDDNSIMNYGDISTVSFHATKLFHTIEGGAIIAKDKHLVEKIRKLINFGITKQDCIDGVGINAKMNEFQAAMGLCILDDIEHIRQDREQAQNFYNENLSEVVKLQKLTEKSNASYAPVCFRDEKQLLRVVEELNNIDVYPRRYFYPSLDTLDYIDSINKCECSFDLSKRILCLPLYAGLKNNTQEKIVSVIKKICEE